MNKTRNHPEKPSRREFIRRTVAGASLAGLGGAAGMLVSAGQTPAAPTPGERVLGREFTYDVSALTKVDPRLIGYAESAHVDTGFKEIRGIAVTPEDQLIVAGDQALHLYDKSGAFSKSIELSDRPRCVALGGAERPLLYIGMARHVQVYDLNGVRLAAWENLGENAVITSIAPSAKDVFVADAGNRVVVRFDLQGRKIGLIGKKNPAKDILGFVVPSPYFEVGVANDLVWAVNPARHRIEAYTFEGDLTAAWGVSSNAIDGFCGCCNPIHFTRLPGGRFVTSEKGIPRVKVYSAEGKLECVVAAPDLFPEQLKNPNVVKPCLSLAVNSAQQVLVADGNSRAVRIFSPHPSSEQKS